MSDSESSDSASPRQKSELELLREKNIRERDAYIASLMSNPEFAEAMGYVSAYDKNPEKKGKSKKTEKAADPTFRAQTHILIPLERRRSARLENKSPIFTKDDLLDESTFKRKKYVDDDYSDIDNIVYQPKKSRKSFKRAVPYIPLISVEDVTESMINKIARKVSIKKYSEDGSCCHQCRQKTLDQKTCCRNSTCVGLRGQFCGVCLDNRYGEDAAVALKDPNWQCPVCRGICNCSFCRAKAGKRPTGILAPQAQQAGHKSVKDFLDSLKGEGDYPNHDDLWEKLKDPKYLLGFSEDLAIAYMGGGIQHKIDYALDIKKMEIFLKQEETKLIALVEEFDDFYDLLGFVEGSGNAQMNNNIRYDLRGSRCLRYIEAFVRQQQNKIGVLEQKLLNGIALE